MKIIKILKNWSICNLIITICLIVRQLIDIIINMFPKKSETMIARTGLFPTFLWRNSIIVLLMQIISIYILLRANNTKAKNKKIIIFVAIAIIILTFFIHVLWWAPVERYANIYTLFLINVIWPIISNTVLLFI